MGFVTHLVSDFLRLLASSVELGPDVYPYLRAAPRPLPLISPCGSRSMA